MNKPDTSSTHYKHGIFARIGREWNGPNSKYWTNKQIKRWMDLNSINIKNLIKE